MTATSSAHFAVTRPSASMSDEQADAVLDLLDSILGNRWRRIAAGCNPPGWTPWRRAVWLGLLTA